MIGKILTVSAFMSAIFFPWPYTLILTITASRYEPLIPLAVGIFMDMLYYSSAGEILPLFTIGGAIITAIALILHNRLQVR